MSQSLAKIYIHLVFSTKGQEEHHKKVSFQDELRKICQLYNVQLDERYAWD